MSENYRHLLELLANGRKSDKGKTAREIATELGIGLERSRALLKDAISKGMIVLGRRQIDAIDGRKMTTPVYIVRRAGSADHHEGDGAANWVESADHHAPKKKRKPSVHGRKGASSFQH